MDEYILTTPPPDPNEEELKVGPVEAESAAEVLARIERREREALAEDEEPEEHEPIEPPSENPTFTLKQMLIVMTALSVWLGVLRIISAFEISMLTGLTGVVALGLMFWLSAQENQPKILRVIWWGMLFVYITCAAATLLT